MPAWKTWYSKKTRALFIDVDANFLTHRQEACNSTAA